MRVERFEIAPRFCGPPRSGNGGYTCGRIAKHIQGTAAVRLKAPPPLDAELRLESNGDEARLFHGEAIVGEGRRSQLDLELPPDPGYQRAEDSSRTFIGFKTHAFPGCFVCGTQRDSGDGLRIFPGRVGEAETIAAPWIPDASLADETGRVASEFLWSALDCTAAFTVLPDDPAVAIVLGELCASLLDDVRAGEKCTVIAWPLGQEGRKRYAGSAIYGEDGRKVALARSVWIEVTASKWN